MIKAIKAWWRRFRRDCVRTSLMRHYGFTVERITDGVIDDIMNMSEKLNISTATSSMVLAAYGVTGDMEKTLKAIEYLYKRGAIVSFEMICWTVRNGKV